MKSCFLSTFFLFLASSQLKFSLADDQQQEDVSYTVCEDTAVLVNHISLLCDSPGTYYYGSGKYRNSQKCQAGDKAKLEVELIVTEDLAQPGYIQLNVGGYGTVENVQLYQGESLCQLSSMAPYCNDSDGDYPLPGVYYIQKQFYWGSKSDNFEYSFHPKVVIGIQSMQNSNNYDLGGANTELCEGNSFTRWSSGVRKSAANTLITFLVTFGILTFAILAMVGGGYLIMRTATMPAMPPTIKSVRKEPLISQQEEEANKSKMLGANHDLVEV